MCFSQFYSFEIKTLIKPFHSGYWYMYTGILENNEDTDKMPHKAAFHQGQHRWLKDLHILTYNPSKYKIDNSRVRLAPWNWFKPSSKIFYWPFQGGTSFVDLLCFCSALCLLCLCARLFICSLWSPAGKGLTSLLSFVVSAVSLSLSHWYPGSGVVLDYIDSWSLHPCLLSIFIVSLLPPPPPNPLY